MKLTIIAAGVAIAGAYAVGHLTTRVTGSTGAPPHLCIETIAAQHAGLSCWGDPVSQMAWALEHEGLSVSTAFCVADTDAGDARFAGQFQLWLGAALDGDPHAAEGTLLGSSGACGS